MEKRGYGERTLKFIENYKRLFDDGKETRDIIGEYGLSFSYGYKLIASVISKKEKVPKESLLRHPHRSYERTKEAKSNARRKVVANETEIEQRFKETKEKIGRLLEEIHSTKGEKKCRKTS